MVALLSILILAIAIGLGFLGINRAAQIGPFLTVSAAIVALILGYRSKKQIARSGGSETGRWLAAAARAIAWIEIVVFALLLLLLLVLAGLFSGCPPSDCLKP